MTALAPHPAPRPLLDLRPVRWHRPLLVLAAAMAALALFSAVAMLVDPRQVTGLDVWAKPLKFAISTALYSFTLAWLIGQLRDRLQRLAWIAGVISAVGLSIELVLITGIAAIGETSHFNVSTPFHTAVWAIMAVSIVVVWSMTLVIGITLFRNRLGDPGRTLAIRAGVVIAFVGMGLAFLMTGPKGSQISDYTGIVGAHAVGVPDGGPGLPLLGWSTVGGDLRIPHFIGMHALQVIPIVVIVLELLGRRYPRFADPILRYRLVAVVAVTYLAIVALATWQALSGQSIVQPSGPILVAGIALAAVAVAGIAAALVRSGRVPTGNIA